MSMSISSSSAQTVAKSSIDQNDSKEVVADDLIIQLANTLIYENFKQELQDQIMELARNEDD